MKKMTNKVLLAEAGELLYELNSAYDGYRYDEDEDKDFGTYFFQYGDRIKALLENIRAKKQSAKRPKKVMPLEQDAYLEGIMKRSKK